MRAEVVTSESAFLALRDDWNRLAAGDPLATWEWRHAWWQSWSNRRRLAIGVVRDGERVVAILPGFTELRPWSGRTLALLGNGKACTDYQRVLLDRDLVDRERYAAIELLLDEMLRRGGALPNIDLFELDGVNVSEPSVATIVELLAQRKFAVDHEPLDSSWITDLNETWDGFVAGTPRQLRRKIHKAMRRAESPDISYHEAGDPETVAAIWSEFVRLHQARFRDRTDDGGCFVDSRFEQFLRDAAIALAAKQQAKIVWCEHLGRAISAHLYLLGRRTVAMYQSGFDPDYQHLEPGYLLYSLAIRSLINAGYAHFDFLRGDETYKSGWAARPIPLARLVCVAPRATSRIRHRTRCWARSLKRVAVRTWKSRRGEGAASPAAPAPIGSDGVELVREQDAKETVNV
ncbi:MAG: hypothetical protein C0483_23525 [Pirellula sp.]|nr:hypothetical protein [Pirellula sp.]